MKLKKSKKSNFLVNKNMLFFITVLFFVNVMSSSDGRIAPEIEAESRSTQVERSFISRVIGSYCSSSQAPRVQAPRVMKVSYILNNTPYRMVVFDRFGKKREASQGSKVKLNSEVRSSGNCDRPSSFFSLLSMYDYLIAFDDDHFQALQSKDIHVNVSVDKESLQASADFKIFLGQERGQYFSEKTWNFAKCERCNTPSSQQIENCVSCNKALQRFQSSRVVSFAMECSVKPENERRGTVTFGYSVKSKKKGWFWN